MTKKKLALILCGLVLILAAGGGYVWFNYNRAQGALSRAQVSLRTVEARLRGDRDLERATEAFTLAQIVVEEVERSHSTWIGRDGVDAMRKQLNAYKDEIDGLKKQSGR